MKTDVEIKLDFNKFLRPTKVRNRKNTLMRLRFYRYLYSKCLYNYGNF